MKARAWIIQYGVAIGLAIGLGLLLGSIPLFRETALGSTKLKASDLAQFLGYGGALLMFWLCGRHAAEQIPTDWKWVNSLRHLFLPLTTLLVVTAAYGVMLLLCGPFFDKTGRAIYNWLFVIGISSSALWVVLTWFLKSASLVASVEMPRKVKRQAA